MGAFEREHSTSVRGSRSCNRTTGTLPLGSGRAIPVVLGTSNESILSCRVQILRSAASPPESLPPFPPMPMRLNCYRPPSMSRNQSSFCITGSMKVPLFCVISSCSQAAIRFISSGRSPSSNLAGSRARRRLETRCLSCAVHHLCAWLGTSRATTQTLHLQRLYSRSLRHL